MGYSEKYIAEFMKGIDPLSILVIVGKGELRRLFCPFAVIVVVPVGNLEVGEIVSVQAVKLTLELKDVYVINGKAYYLIYFRILL